MIEAGALFLVTVKTHTPVWDTAMLRSVPLSRGGSGRLASWPALAAAGEATAARTPPAAAAVARRRRQDARSRAICYSLLDLSLGG